MVHGGPWIFGFVFSLLNLYLTSKDFCVCMISLPFYLKYFHWSRISTCKSAHISVQLKKFSQTERAHVTNIQIKRHYVVNSTEALPVVFYHLSPSPPVITSLLIDNAIDWFSLFPFFIKCSQCVRSSVSGPCMVPFVSTLLLNSPFSFVGLGGSRDLRTKAF